MVKIRYLSLFDVANLKKMKSHIEEDVFLTKYAELLYNPFSFLNQLLPIGLKRLVESYIAIENSEPKGLISIKSRWNNPYKWRIKNLLLEKESIEIGEQLINFVVSKYGAKGVESIEVDINSNETDIIELFSKVCGFRYCLDYQYYELKKDYYKNRVINAENLSFRPFKAVDAKAVSELYNQNISVYYKFPLSKSPKEFNDFMFSGLKNKYSFKFVVEDKFMKKIRGFIQVETENNKDFMMEILVLPSYEMYFEDFITFSILQIHKRTKNFNLYFKNNKFHTNSEDFEKILIQNGDELLQTNMIFVKDFFRKIKDENKISSNAIIYTDIKGKPVYKL